MKDATTEKMFYFIDESGDNNFFDRKGNDLVTSGKASQVFIVGFIYCADMNKISKAVENLRHTIAEDKYIQDIPSVKKSLVHFHAKDDCPEVREKMFKVIDQLEIKANIIVARKNSAQFKTKFNANKVKMYEYLIEKLFENRLHLNSEIDIYFSKMGNSLRENNMLEALNRAKNSFSKKWGTVNNSKIRVFIQEPSQIKALQVVDYIIWTINRAYEKKDMRYFNFIKDKIGLVIDIFDNEKYPKNYYHSKNEFHINKISPLTAR